MSIAIDFGSTNTCVAASLNQQIKIIPSDQGNLQTPSWVAFVGDCEYVGEAAKNYQRIDPRNTIYDLKRLICSGQSDLARGNDFPFQLEEENDRIKIKITDNKGERLMHPEDIVGIIFSRMKEAAERYLHTKLHTAAITVPPYFTRIQRSLLENATRSAGLEVSMIIEEPIAAAYQFDLHNQGAGDFLVFHLGGNTLCVTVLHSNGDGILEIKDYTFENSLGGDNFTQKLMDHCTSEIQRKHKVDLRSDNEAALTALRDSCEQMKKILSRDETASVYNPGILPGVDFEERIGRAQFENLMHELSGRISNTVGMALESAGTDEAKIKKVLLIGGSTRMHLIRKMMSNRFGKNKIAENRTPDETVASGALVRLGNTFDEGEVREVIHDSGESETHFEWNEREPTITNGIGIDLGTTFSSIAVLENNRVKVLEDDFGCTSIPSCVFFNPESTEVLVGHSAQNARNRYPHNCIRDAKRMIGLPYDDANLKEKKRSWEFDVVDENGNPKFQVTYNRIINQFSPEEISARVLGELKMIGEKRLGKTIHEAVISVPSRFGHIQRKATENAARMAGIKVKYIVHEPAAAISANELNASVKKDTNALVFDFGGGTLDITIFSIHMDGKIFERTSSGDNYLGGEDLTERLLHFVRTRHLEKYEDDILKDEKGKVCANKMNYYRDECEKQKKSLSVGKVSSFYLKGHTMEITRADFENECNDLFDKALAEVDKAVKQVKMTEKEIQTVVLVGGTSRIPKIQKMLRKKFKYSEIKQSNNPEEDVAKGSALYAKMIESGKECLFGVTRLSLGIAGPDGSMIVVIPRDKSLPYSKTLTLRLEPDAERRVSISVYEGDRVMVLDNMYVGTLRLPSIPKSKDRNVGVDVTFIVDKNGVEVRGGYSGSKRKDSAAVFQCKVLSEEEVESMVKEAEAYQRNDEELKKDAEKRLDARVTLTLVAKKRSRKKFFESRRQRQKRQGAEKILNWVHNHRDASLSEIRARERELIGSDRLLRESFSIYDATEVMNPQQYTAGTFASSHDDQAQQVTSPTTGSTTQVICKKQTIGPRGGKITLAGCSITFPPGAVRKDTEFHVSLQYRVHPSVGDGIQITPILQCLPRMKFAAPVKFQVPMWCHTSSDDVMAQVMMQEDANDAPSPLVKVSFKNRNGLIEFESQHFTWFWSLIKRLSRLVVGEIEYVIQPFLYLSARASNFCLTFHLGLRDEPPNYPEFRNASAMLNAFTLHAGEEVRLLLRYEGPNPDDFEITPLNEIFVADEEFLKVLSKHFPFTIRPKPRDQFDLTCRIGERVARFQEKWPEPSQAVMQIAGPVGVIGAHDFVLHQ